MSKGAGVVEEATWWLEVNGERIVAGTARPDHMRALAAGRLLAGGWIRGAADIEDLDIGLDPIGTIAVRARVPAARARKARNERTHVLARGCGLMHFVTCDRTLRRRRPEPPVDGFRDIFRALFEAADRASPIGGLHAAALCRDGAMMEPREDVGRHNAVDKAIGEAVLAGLDPTDLGLVITSRISAEIAVKAARANLAWLASRSIPTTLADSIARVVGLPLVARAPGPDPAFFGAVSA